MDSRLAEAREAMLAGDEARAAALWRALAEAGHPEAQAMMGCLHAEGDPAEAARWYRLAAEQGHRWAALALGDLLRLRLSRGKERDASEAMSFFRVAASAEPGGGDPLELLSGRLVRREAARALGEANDWWQGGVPDPAEVLAWRRQAAELGDVHSQCNLAERCTLGLGLRKDWAQALGWWRRAATQGQDGLDEALPLFRAHRPDLAMRWSRGAERRRYHFLLAKGTAAEVLGICHLAGTIVPKDPEEADRWFQLAIGCGLAVPWPGLQGPRRSQADEDPAPAGREPAPSGLRGDCAARDSSERFRLLREAARQGDAEAAFLVGRALAKGLGVPRDDAEAAKYYLQAAMWGHARAQLSYGLCCGSGRGVPQDEDAGLWWVVRSSDQGLPEAALRLGMFAQNGVDIEPDEDEAAFWYLVAADDGLAEAQFRFAWRHGVGQGLRYQEAECWEWMRRAAEQGHAQAKVVLGLAQGCDPAIPEDLAQAVRHLLRSNPEWDVETERSPGLWDELDSGIVTDPRQVAHWFRQAAAHSSPRAGLLMGLCLVQAAAESLDLEEAGRWFLRAAEARLPEAQVQLARLAGNEPEAERWYRLAANQGHPVAVKWLEARKG